MSETIKENKMGTMPINKLLITMALPMIISMIVQSLYNIVDSIFVAQINEHALTSVSLAFPMQTFMISMGTGLGVGMNAVLSRCLGAKDNEGVKKAAMNGIFIAVIMFLIFVALGLFAAKPFMHSQTKEAEIANGGVTYLRIVCICSFGFFTQMTFEKLLQSTGKTLYTMITQSTGAIINIILDPIFIFGYAGVPKMGIAGAAIATVIGQCIAGVLAVIINLKKNHEIDFEFKGFKPHGKTIGNILSISIPSIIMASVGSVMVYGMNKILMGFTSTAAAVFGVYFKLQSFVFMPVFGLNNGMVPIVAYSYGARNSERLIKTVKLSMVYAVGMMIAGFIIMQLFPTPMLMMFKASEEMLAIGVPALRTISIHFLFAGVSIICLSVFQALGKSMLSMFVSLTRQIVFLLPAAYLLSLTGNVNNVWFSFAIAEIASVSLSMIFFLNLNKKVIKNL